MNAICIISNLTIWKQPYNLSAIFLIFKVHSVKARIFSRKINYPSADRNKGPILQILDKHFDHQIYGSVLEISSGTGQHLAHFAPHFPRLQFQPTEYDKSLFGSIKAYCADVPTKNVKDPIYLDIQQDWRTWNLHDKYDYAININMIHVAPFSCTTGLFKNVSGVLKPRGLLITYGPYANNGVLEPQSNRDFDRNIRQRDPNFGVRDIQDLIKLAEAYNMNLTHIHEMPSNNKCLVWEKVM